MQLSPKTSRLIIAITFSKTDRNGRSTTETLGSAYAIRKLSAVDAFTFWGSGFEIDVSAMAAHAMIRILESCPAKRANKIEIICNYTNILISRRDWALDDKIHRDTGNLRKEKSREELWLRLSDLNLLHDVQYFKELLHKQEFISVKRSAKEQADKIAAKWPDLPEHRIVTDGEDIDAIWN